MDEVKQVLNTLPAEVLMAITVTSLGVILTLLYKIWQTHCSHIDKLSGSIDSLSSKIDNIVSSVNASEVAVKTLQQQLISLEKGFNTEKITSDLFRGVTDKKIHNIDKRLGLVEMALTSKTKA